MAERNRCSPGAEGFDFGTVEPNPGPGVRQGTAVPLGQGSLGHCLGWASGAVVHPDTVAAAKTFAKYFHFQRHHEIPNCDYRYTNIFTLTTPGPKAL